MKNIILARSFVGIYIVSILAFVALFVTNLVFAGVSGGCWFTSTTGPVSGTGSCTVQGTTTYGDYGTNDVLPGRNPSGGGAAIPNNINTKQEFVNFIVNKFNSGNAHEKIGAAFIMQTMRPGQPRNWPSAVERDDWINLMNQPSVVVTRETRNVGWTSYYDNNKRNTFFATHTTVARTVIAVRQNGADKGYIETGCGNMVAGVRPVDHIMPQWSISADTTVNGQKDIKVRYGTTVNFHSYTLNNGPNALDRNVNADRYTTQGDNNFVALDLPNGYPSGWGKNDWYNFTVPNDTVRRCANVWTDVQAWDNLNPRWWSEACVTGVPPPTPANITPFSRPSGDYEKGGALQKFTVGATIKHPCDRMVPDGTNAGTITYISKSYIGSYIGPSVSGSATLLNCASDSNPSQDVNANVDVLKNLDPGSSETRSTTITGEPPGSTVSNNPATSSIVVYEVPYARFYGQDIYATGCDSAAPNNGKAFFNTKNPASGDGGASQYAAIAKSTVNMATAAFRSSAPMPQNGLAVANYSGPVDCSDTVYNNVISNLKTPISAGTITYSNSSITTSATIATTGDIYISGNITGGGLNKIVTLVAGGNIYISPSVTRIDAVLISKGMVYTCANASGNGEAARSTWQTSCRETLTINGAVSAKDIRFARSVGTRLMASTGEDSGSAGKDNIDTRTGSNSTAAEVINYPAYLNFSSLNLIDNSLNSVNAIFNVPPLL